MTYLNKAGEKMSKKNKISACLLTLNEEYILDLVFKQIEDYVDDIVILDGGSTDGTVKMAKAHKKTKVFVIPQPGERYGLGWNEGDRRNIIEDAATGDWILCLGCDEFLDDNFYDNIEDFLNVDEKTVGWGFFRINYLYSLDYHLPIHQPPNGGEVRLYRNTPKLRWTMDNKHNFIKYNNEKLIKDCKPPLVYNTKLLIHHVHRIGIKGKPAIDRRDPNSEKAKNVIPAFERLEKLEDGVKNGRIHKYSDRKYSGSMEYPRIFKLFKP